MNKIINTTPHDIKIVSEEGEVLRTFPKAETPVRVAATVKTVGELDCIAIEETVFGEVEGLPEAEEGTYYIVSRLVASAASGRTDLLVPGQQVRNSDGVVVGCKSLSR